MVLFFTKPSAHSKYHTAQHKGAAIALYVKYICKSAESSAINARVTPQVGHGIEYRYRNGHPIPAAVSTPVMQTIKSAKRADRQSSDLVRT